MTRRGCGVFAPPTQAKNRLEWGTRPNWRRCTRRHRIRPVRAREFKRFAWDARSSGKSSASYPAAPFHLVVLPKISQKSGTSKGFSFNELTATSQHGKRRVLFTENKINLSHRSRVHSGCAIAHKKASTDPNENIRLFKVPSRL